ncbi:MAG TPA: DUF5666 domain-containing protein [Chloroflexia bacterium]|nr:DUF5666 domain-containing protein [Chloroflexia bacterium]
MMIRNIAVAIGGVVVLAALAVAALVTGQAGASGPAAPPTAAAGQPVLQVTGKIATVSQDHFTLTVQNHPPYTVSVSSGTFLVVNQAGQRVTGSVTDLHVGDTVTVAGTAGTGEAVDARVVLATAPVAGRRAGAAGTPGTKKGAAATRTPGTLHPNGAGKNPGLGPGQRSGELGPALNAAIVQSVANGVLTLTVEGTAHPVVLQTDASTIVIRNGLATLAALQPGDKVEVRPRRLDTLAPTPGANAQPVAGLIYVVAADHRLLSGEVKTVTGTTVTVLTFGGDYTYTVDATTRLESLGGGDSPSAPAQLSDLVAGSRVFVYSPQVAAGQTATASVVVIVPVYMP